MTLDSNVETARAQNPGTLKHRDANPTQTPQLDPAKVKAAFERHKSELQRYDSLNDKEKATLVRTIGLEAGISGDRLSRYQALEGYVVTNVTRYTGKTFTFFSKDSYPVVAVGLDPKMSVMEKGIKIGNINDVDSVFAPERWNEVGGVLRAHYGSMRKLAIDQASKADLELVRSTKELPPNERRELQDSILKLRQSELMDVDQIRAVLAPAVARGLGLENASKATLQITNFAQENSSKAFSRMALDGFVSPQADNPLFMMKITIPGKQKESEAAVASFIFSSVRSLEENKLGELVPLVDSAKIWIENTPRAPVSAKK